MKCLYKEKSTCSVLRVGLSYSTCTSTGILSVPVLYEISTGRDEVLDEATDGRSVADCENARTSRTTGLSFIHIRVSKNNLNIIAKRGRDVPTSKTDHEKIL
jgi:hypothetical protein